MSAPINPSDPAELGLDNAALPPADISDLVELGLSPPPGYRIPRKYRLDPDRGVSVEVFNKRGELEYEPVCPVVVLITAYVEHPDGLYVRLEWLRGREVRKVLRPAQDVADPTKLIALANLGLPVDKRCASSVVGYLADLQSVNQYGVGLPTARGTAHLGWQGSDAYLLGRILLTGTGQRIDLQDLERLNPADWHHDQIVFRGEGRGEEQAVDGYRESGTLDGWRAMVGKVANYSRAMLALYASMAAPLLEILGAPSYTVDLSGTTSSGKTTALRLALSVWGSTDEHDPGGLLLSWEATQVALERAMALRRGIPLALDDSTRCRKPEVLSRVLYDQSAGRGRARGALQGSREVSVHRTVLLSTGEAPITSHSVAGGQHARALCLTRSPFPAGNPDLVTEIQAGALTHHGVAGVVWVRWLLEHRDEWPAWRDRYAALRAERAIGVSAVQGRLGAYTATITLTAELAKRALGLDGVDPVPQLAAELAEGSGQADLASAAMDTVLSRCRANPDCFWRPDKTDPQRQPNTGWWGSWDLHEDLATGKTTWSRLALFRPQAEALLTQADYSPAAVFRVWADRGWILTDKPNLFAKVRIQGQRSRCVVILPMDDEAVSHRG